MSEIRTALSKESLLQCVNRPVGNHHTVVTRSNSRKAPHRSSGSIAVAETRRVVDRKTAHLSGTCGSVN